MKDFIWVITCLWLLAGNVASASIPKTRDVRPLPQPSVSPVRIQGTAGMLLDARVIEYKSKLYTVVRLLPSTTTDSLNDQGVAFCGDQGSIIDAANDGSPVLLLYSKTMHQRDCFDLYTIIQLPKNPKRTPDAFGITPDVQKP